MRLFLQSLLLAFLVFFGLSHLAVGAYLLFRHIFELLVTHRLIGVYVLEVLRLCLNLLHGYKSAECLSESIKATTLLFVDFNESANLDVQLLQTTQEFLNILLVFRKLAQLELQLPFVDTLSALIHTEELINRASLLIEHLLLRVSFILRSQAKKAGALPERSCN